MSNKTLHHIQCIDMVIKYMRLLDLNCTHVTTQAAQILRADPVKTEEKYLHVEDDNSSHMVMRGEFSHIETDLSI